MKVRFSSAKLLHSSNGKHIMGYCYLRMYSRVINIAKQYKYCKSLVSIPSKGALYQMPKCALPHTLWMRF